MFTTRDDVVSQRLKFGIAHSFRRLGSQKLSCFFNFPVSRVWIFIGRNVEARASQAGLHKPKKDTASAKEGKVRSPCRGGRRLKAVLLIRRKTWPRATENIV